MGKPQRTPAAKFDDIPGQLPPPGTLIPENVNLKEVADQAINKLNRLQPDDLAEIATWRDLLSFTGTYRTFFSRSAVLTTFQQLGKTHERSDFRLATGSEPRTGGSLGDISWVDVDLAFSVQHGELQGECAGIASLIYSDGKWRIWMLRTWLECFREHGHPDHLNSPTTIPETTSNGTTKDDTERDDGKFDAIIVGAGQAGLSLAGRLKALGVSYIVLEQRPEVGNVWATRYESLRWHTSKHYGSLPFGHTYAEEEDYMLPAKRIGAGQKAWAERHAINVRTSTSVHSASYDADSREWTVTATSLEGDKTLKARELALAIGTGHLTPVVPAWATPENVVGSDYAGTVVHGSKYISSSPWDGKHGIVIGTANTAHDVAEDMANAGMDTTMVQRSHTFVFPAPWLHHAEDIDYNPNKDPALADRQTYTYPLKVMRENINRVVHHLIRSDPKPFDELENAGFKLDRYGDIYDNLFVRFGGHYVDIGASARIAKGEIKVKTEAVRGLTKNGILFEDGSELPADLIVLCTGFDHDFRNDASQIVGKEIAHLMDDFWGVDAEGEIRGMAKYAGHPHLYYCGGDIRNARFFSRFTALQMQAEVLGHPMQRYDD